PRPEAALHAPALPARGLVPLQRQLLFTLSSERPARLLPRHRHVARRFPLREVAGDRRAGGPLTLIDVSNLRAAEKGSWTALRKLRSPDLVRHGSHLTRTLP